MGVGQTHIFGGGDEQATGKQFWVFAAFRHAGEPVNSGIGIAAADGFDEGGDDVVVHLSVFVVLRRVLLKQFADKLVGKDHRFAFVVGIDYQLDDVEEFAGVAARKTQQIGRAHV